MCIAHRLINIKATINEALIAAHRAPDSVRILAVTKGRNLEDIQQAYQAGLIDFGESYVQEATQKIDACRHLPVRWHFIGPLQSNKAKKIAQNFSWVHSVCSKKVANLLNDARHESLPRLQICIQINVDDNKQSGIRPDEVIPLAQHIMTLPRLQLRGLMMIPKQMTQLNEQNLVYKELNEIFSMINQSLHGQLDTCSMGMSEDYLAAIRAGSTMVRLGRIIFEKKLTTEST